MPRPAPTLLRRAAPAPAATIADDLLFAPPCGVSLTSPRSPPGFPRPQSARSDLVASLFPQLAGISLDLHSWVIGRLSATYTAISDPSVPSPKVRFAVKVVRLEGAPPPPVHGAHRPCLKSASASTFKSPGWQACRDTSPGPASPAVHPRQSSNVLDNLEDGWQLVRPPYWWRESRSNHLPSSRSSAPSYSSPRQRDFVKLKDRTCHRCLLKGHCKANCRNPFTCLRCRQFGHRARVCTNPPSASSAALSIGRARPRDSQQPELRHFNDNARHRRDAGHVREDCVREVRRGQEGIRRSSSSGSHSRASVHRADVGCQESHPDDRGCCGDRDGRCRVVVPASLYARKISPAAHVRGSSCSAVSPDDAREEDISEARSPPPSPRTTADDIIEIIPMSPSMETSPHLAPTSVSSQRLQEDLGEPAMAVHPPSAGEITPIFVPRTPTSSPPRTPTVRRRTTCFVSQVAPSANIDGVPVIVSPDAPPTQDAMTPVDVQPAGDRGNATPHSPLFVPLQPALLPAPNSTPPRPPTTRRKTLAGITSFNLGRRSPRL